MSSRTTIAVPLAALVAGAALVGTPAVASAAPVAPAQTAKMKPAQYPVSKHMARKWNLKQRELKEIKRAKRWASTAKSRSVIRCESGFDYNMVDGPYKGAWQFLDSTWRGAGGGRYASAANYAPKFAQDHIAWKLWKRSGWGPWSCA